MPKATQSKQSEASLDAIALLKQDHRLVEQLFDEFEDAEDEQLDPLAERICKLLTVHTQIEEELLYPAAQESIEDDDLVQEALVEHGSAKELISKIEAMSSDDEEFKATVKVLGEYVRHHVKEEEGELFPEMKKAKVDLQELGSNLMERKTTLMEELGLHEEDERGAVASQRASSRASRGGARSRSGARSANTRSRAH